MLEWTGERFLPWIEGAQIQYEHLHRYAFAAQLVKGKRVLDLAFGEGYGPFMLSREAEQVVGVEIDEQVINHASSRYLRDNLKFIQGSILDIPIEEGKKFDIITCFEGIEHIEEHDKLLSEVKRLLRDDGLFIVSTPNKATYTDEPQFHSPFHVKELYFNEFKRLLGSYFKNVHFLGQRVYAGSNLWNISSQEYSSYKELVIERGEKEFYLSSTDRKAPIYFIALASDTKLERHISNVNSWLVDVSDILIKDYHKQITELSNTLQAKDSQLTELGNTLQAKDSQITELGNTLQAKDSQITELGSTLQAKDSQITELGSTIQAKDSQINHLQIQIQQIQRGIVMQLLSKYQRVVEKLLRSSTRRRYYYELGLTGIRVILNEGWRSFFRKVKIWFRLRRATERRHLPALPTFKASISRKEAKKLAFRQPSQKPELSIIIPVYNKWKYTVNCLKSICENTGGDYEVIMVDDASSDETIKVLSRVKNLHLVRNEKNAGFIESCNRGAKVSKGDYILFLNNDTMVTKDWLPPLLEVIRRDDVGAVGSKLVYPDGTLQEAGGIIWNDGSGWNCGRGDDPERPEYNYVREVDYCSGACLLVKRELFEKIEGLDERFKPGYYEDSDLCFSLRNLGYKVMYQPMSLVVHFEGVTCGTDTSSGIKKYQEINKPKFMEKWSAILQRYHYNPSPENVFVARNRLPGKSILVVDHYVPTYDKDSGSLRMFNMLKILAELGNRVIFIGDSLLRMEPYTQELQQKGIEVIYAPYISSVEDYIKRCGKYFDTIILSRLYVAMKYIDMVKTTCPAARIVYDTVDLVFLRESRRARVENNEQLLKQAEELKRTELHLAQNSDITLVVSPVEKTLLLKESPSLNIEVVSNIHHVTQPQKSFSERKDILFVGGFDHLPNIDAATFFVEEVFPLVKQRIPDLCFYIAGSNPPSQVHRLKSKDIIVTGYVKDLTPYFENCKLSVSPLRYGAGVKGKINQSMSYGLPVVTTSIGAEGIGLTEGEDALIADDPQEFAKKVILLYQDEDLWNKISQNSVKQVEKNYSFELAKEKLKNCLNNIVK